MTPARILRLSPATVLALAVLLVASVQVLLAWTGVSPVLSDRLMDTDCYMRLDRVLALATGQAPWFDATQMRANAPYGLLIGNWSRLLDLLLLAGAWPLSHVMGWEKALFAWGTVFSPLLLAAALPILRWGWRDLLDDRLFLLAVVLMMIQPQLVETFMLGRPDHHSLMLLLFAGQTALLLRLAAGTAPAWADLALGGIGALALWVSIESLLPQAFVGASLAVLWLLGSRDARHLPRFAGTLTAGVMVALAIERPPADWLTPFYDRFSVVHVAMLATTTLAWTIVAAWAPRRRWLAGLLAAMAPLAVLALSYPDFFKGPMADFPPELRADWWGGIGELQPTLPGTRPGATADFFASLGGLLVTAPLLLRRLRTDRLAFVVLALGGLWFGLFTLYQLRFASYAQLVALPLWALTVQALFRRCGPPWRALAVVAAIAFPVAASAAARMSGNVPSQPSALRRVQSCDGAMVTARLRDLGDAVVLTYVFEGPELLWLSGVRVVGAPYLNRPAQRDRHLDQVMDTFAFFRDEGDETARAIALRRGVSHVLVCAANVEANDYRLASGRSLHQRLERGEPPAWLEPLDLPGPARLYQVRR